MKAVGKILAIAGAVFFIVFLWTGLWMWGDFDYGLIGMCIAFLVVVFVGGLFASSSGRRSGKVTTTYGFIGVFIFGLIALFTYFPTGSFVFVICGMLASISLAVMVFGLGTLSGTLSIPRKGKVNKDTTLPATGISTDEPSDEEPPI